MSPNEELISQIFPNNEEENKYEEEWEVVLNTGGKYTLSKLQAWGLRHAISQGERGIVMYQSFSISIPYIAEFYRIRRFLKDTRQLPKTASEKPFKPVSPKKWEKIREEIYGKIGKSLN